MRPTKPAQRRRLLQYRLTFALGMASIVVSLLGFGLVFLPVVGIPVSGLGMLAALVALASGLVLGGPLTLRWSLGGLGLGCLALALNVAMTFTPAGFIRSRPPAKNWQELPGRALIPPPAGVSTVETAKSPNSPSQPANYAPRLSTGASPAPTP
jgi:hypothetical protein